MKSKIIFIFLLAIFIPTSLLAYFGLLAVKSEKSIVEKSMRQKYEAVADIVEGEIRKTVSHAQKDLLENPKYLEHIVLEAAALFKDEVVILGRNGGTVGEEKNSGKPEVIRDLKYPPYKIAVYERYPVLLKKMEEKKHNLSLYVGVIYLSAFLILSGAFITLTALSRQWRMARLRNEFAQHIAHELKKPLTSIRMFSEMLKTGRAPGEDKKKEYYNIISNESEKLTYLANNVLDFARIETGRRNFNFERKDLGRVVAETVERFKTYMVDGPRPVVIDIKEDIPPVKIDEGAVSQAVMNLLTNAAKYSTPDKEIKVNLRLLRHAAAAPFRARSMSQAKACGYRMQHSFNDNLESHREVVIEVIDQGIGIPKAEREKIFGRFYRVSRKEVSETEGSGLGLSLVKYIAEAHNGQVKVESEEGKGSKFSLVIPI